MNALKSIVVGFIAGAIAAVTVQELVSWLFVHYWTGWNEIPWSTEPVPSLVYPDIVMPWIASTALTGGLWGALFGLILGWKPEGMMTIRGAILGLVVASSSETSSPVMCNFAGSQEIVSDGLWLERP